MKNRIIFPAICFLVLVLSAAAVLSSCSAKKNAPEEMPEPVDSMRLDFATQFSVLYLEGGYKLLSFADSGRILLVPEGAEAPEKLDEDVKVLYQPVKRIYLAATSAMCLFNSLERLDAISLSGTKEDGWYIPEAREAMAEGRIVYAGKYSQPDYELITATGCPLAVESTMIGHASDIKDQLEQLGVVVLIDQSSNEPHPLGRAEWIKLYGALLNEEEKADSIFREQADYLNAVSDNEPSGKTVAFFYVSSTGRIIARKSGDYVCKMISLAGGEYIFDDIGDSTLRTTTVTLEPEFFYSEAKDADIIIYNATTTEEISSLSQMLEKCELLKDFKAVKNGDVWCTHKNMYQESTALGEMINSLYRIFSDDPDIGNEVPFFYRLQ